MVTARRSDDRGIFNHGPAPAPRPKASPSHDGSPYQPEASARVPGELPADGASLARDVGECAVCGEVGLLAAGSDLCERCEELSRAAAHADADRCALCGRGRSGLVRCECPVIEATAVCLRCGFSARVRLQGADAALVASSRVANHRKTAHATGKLPSFRGGDSAKPSRNSARDAAALTASTAVADAPGAAGKG